MIVVEWLHPVEHMCGSITVLDVMGARQFALHILNCPDGIRITDSGNMEHVFKSDFVRACKWTVYEVENDS